MNVIKQEISFNDLTEIIAEAVIEKNYLNKQELMFELRCILNAFHLKLKVSNYNKFFNETKTENALMKYERMELEYQYFKLHLKTVLEDKDYKDIINKVNSFTKTLIKTHETTKNN